MVREDMPSLGAIGSFYIAILPCSAYKCLVEESTVNVCAHAKSTILALEDGRAVGTDEEATLMEPIGYWCIAHIDGLYSDIPLG